MLSKVVFVLGMILSFNSINFNDYMRYDDLSVYRERLADFNENHNTNYMIPDEPAEGDHEDMIKFVTSMTLKEFDEYILSLYQSDIANPDPAEKYAATEPITNDNSIKYKSQNNSDDFISNMMKNLPVRDEKFSFVYLD